MKKLLLLAILLLFGIKNFGQNTNENLNQATTDFTKLSADFKTIKDLNEIEVEKFKRLNDKLASKPTNEIIDSLKIQLSATNKSIAKLDSIYLLYESYKKVYLNKGILESDIEKLFAHQHTISDKILNNDINEPKTYLYYGDDLILEELKPTGNKKVDDVIKTILSKESKSYLGDIIIPQENQEFRFYIDSNKTEWKKFKAILKDENSKFISLEKKYKFKSVSFEILEGFFTDIKVFVLDEKGNEHLFENKSPVSILRYSTHSSINFLTYKHPINQKESVKFGEFKDLRIRLSDVLMYVSKPGYNFIPNDITFDFPTKNEKGVFLNKDNPVKYEIKEDTSLQNIVELRAYTDFLGLFADSPNGIIQFQGKGDFYVFPFLTPKSKIDFRFLDKISPYVNFSRIEDDSRAVETVILPNSNITPKNSLDLIQKAYLEMGTVVNVFNLKLNKEIPFRTIGYFPARYQISDVIINNEYKSIQGFAYGFGLKFEFKRFNNFGFNYSLEYAKYSFKDYNSTQTFESPDTFGVYKNEAEVFYHPSATKKQSIFLRFTTFNNRSNNEAFYQLQFGYRFSIGISDVKTKS